MIYHIAICDDNRIEAELVADIVHKWSQRTKKPVSVNCFSSSEAFLFHYAENKNYDILLLDIEMGAMDGVELAKELRRENDTVQIIFITGYPDFLAEGYEVSALHYLLKPVSEEKLSVVLDRAVLQLEKLGKTEKSLIFDTDSETVRIKCHDIVFVEAFAHKCSITTVNGVFEVKMGISEIERMLGEGFIRCHRSYIVGLRFIHSISKTSITLDTGVQIPLSRNNCKPVNQAFIRYYSGVGRETTGAG